MLAACEKKSILMFDPLCRKLIHAIDNAHNDCVNCVRFVKRSSRDPPIVAGKEDDLIKM